MLGRTITIVSVNWYSSDHLKRLAKNLLIKANNQNEIEFLIIDNTNGADSNLISINLLKFHSRLISGNQFEFNL